MLKNICFLFSAYNDPTTSTITNDGNNNNNNGINNFKSNIGLIDSKSKHDSLELDKRYQDRRRRNNEAVRRCRENKRARLMGRSEINSEKLQHDNRHLRNELSGLSMEVKALRRLLSNNNQQGAISSNDDESISSTADVVNCVQMNTHCNDTMTVGTNEADVIMSDNSECTFTGKSNEIQVDKQLEVIPNESCVTDKKLSPNQTSIMNEQEKKVKINEHMMTSDNEADCKDQTSEFGELGHKKLDFNFGQMCADKKSNDKFDPNAKSHSIDLKRDQSPSSLSPSSTSLSLTQSSSLSSPSSPISEASSGLINGNKLNEIKSTGDTNANATDANGSKADINKPVLNCPRVSHIIRGRRRTGTKCSTPCLVVPCSNDLNINQVSSGTLNESPFFHVHEYSQTSSKEDSVVT